MYLLGVESDEALLSAWKDGDRKAGSRLLERYFGPLFRFFRNKVDRGIDDLIQQTLVACVEARDRVREAANFRAFVFGVARNQLFVHLRRALKDPRELDADRQSVVALGSSPSRVLARKLEQKLLVRALRAIPLDYQIALELHYWEDLSGSELATVLGVPEGTVRTRLRRGRQLLIEQLEALAPAPQDLATTRGDLDAWVRSLRAVMAARTG